MQYDHLSNYVILCNNICNICNICKMGHLCNYVILCNLCIFVCVNLQYLYNISCMRKKNISLQNPIKLQKYQFGNFVIKIFFGFL